MAGHPSGAYTPRVANPLTATGRTSVWDEAAGVGREELVWEELDSNGRPRYRLVSDRGMVTPGIENVDFAERMGMPTPRDGTPALEG